MVTPTEVKAILTTTLSDSDIQAFIDGATAVVDQSSVSTTLATTLVKEITRWLAAHMIASTREQQLSSAGAGSAKAVFQGVTGMGLDSTMYGQHVKVLDSTGILASLGKTKPFLMAVEGMS